MTTMHQSPKILVTVGTTEFDPLIEYTSSADFMKMLAENGLGELPITYQIGSTYTFHKAEARSLLTREKSSDYPQIYRKYTNRIP